MTNPTRKPQPTILIRGFGGLNVDDEKKATYQGFNDGTVYPQKRGENYIYEGFILRFLKSSWQYQDATNVVGYYGENVGSIRPPIPAELKQLDEAFFSGGKLIIDPAMALHLVRTAKDPNRTLWVFRYYDLNDRKMVEYGKALLRLIDFIRALAKIKNPDEPEPKVNIIAHSMGGLLVRQAIQQTIPDARRTAGDLINKVVTLGTPHQGIAFQVLKNWVGTEAQEEIEHFNPETQKNPENPTSFTRFAKSFPLDRLLTVVGTNYKSYDVGVAALGNRLFSAADEFGMNYNRSDGLVKQSHAQIPGAPRTFVHKCHGGFDSLVTARESFEIATRFFFGNVKVRLRMIQGEVLRGMDMFGKSEFFFGVCIKPRGVDFELFHQGADSENCYGPFSTTSLTDPAVAFDWAGPDRLIWEGYLNTTPILEDASISKKDMVMRVDFYVGERDLFGVGFSDNVIFRKQYYIRGLLLPPYTMFIHDGEQFAVPGYVDDPATMMKKVAKGWEFDVSGTGFRGRFRIEIEQIPE
jgi:pimeloyl-ACP methyl ester carboxylesterase